MFNGGANGGGGPVQQRGAAAFSTFSAVAVLQPCRRRRRAAAAYGATVCTYYSCWPSKLLRKKYDEATADCCSPLAPGARRWVAAVLLPVLWVAKNIDMERWLLDGGKPNFLHIHGSFHLFKTIELCSFLLLFSSLLSGIIITKIHFHFECSNKKRKSLSILKIYIQLCPHYRAENIPKSNRGIFDNKPTF